MRGRGSVRRVESRLHRLNPPSFYCSSYSLSRHPRSSSYYHLHSLQEDLSPRTPPYPDPTASV